METRVTMVTVYTTKMETPVASNFLEEIIKNAWQKLNIKWLKLTKTNKFFYLKTQTKVTQSVLLIYLFLLFSFCKLCFLFVMLLAF